MSELHENLISVAEAGTLDGLFARRVRRSPDRPAYRYYDRRSDDWLSYDWKTMAAQVARWQAALRQEKLHPGDRVAVQLRNCPEWVMFDQAALSLGLVTVPLYTDDRPDNIGYILEEAAVRLLLVQDAGRWRRLAPVAAEQGALQCVLLLDDGGEAQKFARHDERVRLVDEWLPASGGELHVRKNVNPDDLASIVYTSGTTGRSKGVMLSHRNMLSVAHGSLTLMDCYQEDVFLSFLPLSHTLERTGGYYLPVMSGSLVVYSRSVAQLAEDLRIVRPTVLIAVPRIFERVYGRIKDQMAKRSPIARRLFDMTVRVGWRRFERQQGRAAWSWELLLWPLLEGLVAKKISEKLGGRLRVAVSGGAPLSAEISRIFIGLGVPIVQGYGLTETSPVISVNPLEDNVPASVGVPIRGTEIKIGDQDELLVRGPGVMLGYWNNHKATAQMIDREGWLRTGDQARIDETGHIYITGRIKDIMILSNGEKIPPADMEMAISLDPLFDQVMVVGEGRPFLTALVVVNPEEWSRFATELGLDPEAEAGLHADAAQIAALRRIRAALGQFPGYAKIRKVSLQREPWGIDDGLITPTLKIKRPKVLERFAPDVSSMYGEGAG